MKEGLFNEDTLQKIQKTRKIFLKVAVWILIAELALGAFIILGGAWDISIMKIQGSFLILALVLFVSVNNFIRIEKGDKTVRLFALIGFISNLVWALFALLLIWEALPFNWAEQVAQTSVYNSRSYYVTKYHMTFFAIIMLIAGYTAAAGFWISNVLSIKETIKSVKPLKITAIVCIAYIWAFGTIITPMEPEFNDVVRLYMLSGLAGLAFGVTALAALIISKTNKTKAVELNTGKIESATKPVQKSDAELRAEIEEKVRREMIEKEVRAEMETKKSGKDDK